MDKFGWFYARNGTTWSDGVLTMDTGADDIAKLGNIRQVTLIATLNSLTSLLALKRALKMEVSVSRSVIIIISCISCDT